MPCWNIRTTSVAFGEKTDLDALTKALEGLGYRVSRSGNTLSFSHRTTYASGTFSNGRLDIRSDVTIDENELKSSYMEQCVRKAAKQKGWDVKQDRKDKKTFWLGK